MTLNVPNSALKKDETTEYGYFVFNTIPDKILQQIVARAAKSAAPYIYYYGYPYIEAETKTVIGTIF